MTGAILSVAGMGLLSAISPCPMAANLAAVGFIARQVSSPKRIVLAGFAYALGRVASSVVLAALLVEGLVSAPLVSQFLQKYGARLVGPILIFVGIVLLDLVPFRMPQFGVRSGKWQERLAEGGLVGAFLLGMVFALAMCPPSAALFFGGLVPLATEKASPILLPIVFGVATALPVVCCAVLIGFSAKGLGRILDRIVRVERIVRVAIGLVLIVLGLWRVLLCAV